MSMKDVKSYARECKRALGRWGIAALSDGKADTDSRGYKNKLTKGNYFGCDYIEETLIMVGREKTFEYPDSCDNGEFIGFF